MEMLGKIIIQLLAGFIGWQVGKFIAYKIALRRLMRKARRAQEEEEK